MASEREQLFRRHFDTYSDLRWAMDLEPKLKGIDAEERHVMETAWKKHVESRDWEWWRKEAEGIPITQLEDDLKVFTEILQDIEKERNQWL